VRFGVIGVRFSPVRGSVVLQVLFAFLAAAVALVIALGKAAGGAPRR